MPLGLLSSWLEFLGPVPPDVVNLSNPDTSGDVALPASVQCPRTWLTCPPQTPQERWSYPLSLETLMRKDKRSFTILEAWFATHCIIEWSVSPGFKRHQRADVSAKTVPVVRTTPSPSAQTVSGL